MTPAAPAPEWHPLRPLPGGRPGLGWRRYATRQPRSSGTKVLSGEDWRATRRRFHGDWAYTINVRRPSPISRHQVTARSSAPRPRTSPRWATVQAVGRRRLDRDTTQLKGGLSAPYAGGSRLGYKTHQRASNRLGNPPASPRRAVQAHNSSIINAIKYAATDEQHFPHGGGGGNDTWLRHDSTVRLT